MKTASEIIEAAGGRDAVASVFDLNPRHVGNILRADDKLPASWYDRLEHITGQKLPRRLFSFKAMVE